MQPTTVRLSEEERDALDAEARERGFSTRANYLRWIITHREELFANGELAERVEALEERVDALEADA